MPTRTRVLKSLIHRLSGASENAGHDAEEVFRAFGETVEKRLRSDTDKARRPTRRRTGKEAGR